MTLSQAFEATKTTGLTITELAERQRDANQPSLEALTKHLKFYGPEGVMESASHLEEADQEALKAACREWLKQHGGRSRRR